ncbi:MAG: hypothetical protein ACI8P3_001090 [Saprospiraceae bacterium]|jgi:hypothetical protein
MNTLQANKLIILLVAVTFLPLLVSGQFKDSRKLNTENFDPKKWSSGEAQYHENGYVKYIYKDAGEGRKKRYEYYEDGTPLSEMEVVFKLYRDTIVTFNPDTYEEMIQITENKDLLPDGQYLEYHEGNPDGKRRIHLTGKFREGEKVGTWKITSLSGGTTKIKMEESDTSVDHTDYKSYQSIQEEKNPKINRAAYKGTQLKGGKLTSKKQAYTITTEDDLFGIIDNEQNEIVSPIYKSIISIIPKHGALILQDEKFHLLDLDTKTITANNLDDIHYDLISNLYFFTKEGKKGIIDPDTKKIIVPAIYYHVQAAAPSNGLDKKVFFLYHNKGIDLYYKTKDGSPRILDRAYQSVTPFSLHKDNYAIVEKNKVTELISLESGNSLLTFKNFQDINIVPSRIVFIKSDDSWTVYNNEFANKNPGKFEAFHYHNSGDAHIEVKQNGLWGALDRRSLDSLVIPCQYDSISYASSKMYKTYNKKNGKIGLVNYKREVLAPMEYEDIYTQYSLRKKYWLKENGKYRLFDGEKLDLFDRIILYFKQNFYIVENEGKQGLYSESANQMIIPCEYDSVYRFNDGRSDMQWFRNGIALKKDNDLFFADLEGKMLSDYAFRSIVKVPTKCEIIAKDHNYKSHVIANCSAAFELPSPVDSIRHVDEGAYIISNDGKFGFFSSGSFLDYKVMLPMEYEEILWYVDTPADGSKLIMAKKDGKWLWIDPETGKNKFQYTFDRIDRFYDGRQSDKANVIFNGKKKILRLNGTLEDK